MWMFALSHLFICSLVSFLFLKENNVTTNQDLDVSMDAETQVVRDVKGNFQTGRGVQSETESLRSLKSAPSERW